MSTTYEDDVIVWANEQAALLRAGNLSAIDVEHIADEIESVGKSEQRELTGHMSRLLAHLLKWQFQPSRRGVSWEKTIKAKRIEIEYSLKETPSLKTRLSDSDWLNVVWSKAVAQAVEETGLDVFPDGLIWTMSDIRKSTFFPSN